MEKENCEHKSFSPCQGGFNCCFCKKIFTSEEIKKLLVERRQGFEEMPKNDSINQ